MGAVAIGALGISGPLLAQSNEPIKLGLLISHTGGDAISGLNGKAGVTLAVDEINKAGGILGRQVEIVAADDQSDPTAAVNEARRLSSQEKVDLVFGPQSSQRTLAVLPVFTDAKIPQISTSGSLEITPQKGPYNFSVQANADAQGYHMAHYVTDVLKAKTAAILTDNGAQALSGVPYIKKYLEEGGATVTGVQEFPFRSEDKTAQLLSLKSGNPDSLVIWANTPEDLGVLMNNLADIGWDDVPLSGPNATVMQAASAAKIADPNQFDKVAGVAYVGWTYCPGDDMTKNPFVEFKERLKAANPSNYDSLLPTISGYAYDGIMVMKAAMEATGGTDPEEIKTWIENNADKVATVSGPMKASAESHFLAGREVLTPILNPLDVNEQGLFKRADCK
ncbi:ABC transporter substrate-binding protein [Oryzicola mucosus]|uniref:ABC transporter substrate-binding protein n=1 Tax=Oryzicola mucosus TaxID=2767425 RepID=A0A8J6PZR3_9HYPH|nr:ABC transporter substrate-binding protein [Oryzicola mucosus]MBD0417347.1 ABC transporter substrate-binding protein [Oryzicola mucosus]